MVLEIALALVMLVGSGLMIHSLSRLRQVETGYNPAQLLVFQVDALPGRYPTAAQARAFYTELIERIEALPDVSAAGAASTLPFSGDSQDSRLHIEGGTEPAEGVKLWYRKITPGYFRATGLTILKGRGIERRDQSDAPLVVVLNQAAAQQYFPGTDPDGHVLVNGAKRFTVVGVVHNSRSFTVTAEEPPGAYFSSAQIETRSMGLVARTTKDPRNVVRPVMAALADLDPAAAATHLSTMERWIEASLAPIRALGALVSTFALLALFLAAVGLYGLMSYLSAQREREVGIRMALGSSTAQVLQKVIGEALMLIVAGVVLGLIAAIFLTHLLRTMLFEVGTLDPLSFAASAILLTLVALLAAYLPARRASRLDPVRVLRS